MGWNHNLYISISEVSTTGFRVNGTVTLGQNSYNAAGFNVYTSVNGLGTRNHTAKIPNRGGSYSFSDYYSFGSSHSARNFSCSVGGNFSWSGNPVDSGNPVWANASVPAIASYTVSYNANGGTGAPGNQTKWYNENLTISNTRPTRTGHTFQGWATSPGGGVAYQPGATYTSNAALTLYAVWRANTWTVSYNANGGSGAPGNQTKWFGATLTLSSTRPTRNLYNFKGWGTSPNSTTPSYQPGGLYINNASITLYAIWELAWVAPRITNLTADRCTSDGTLNEEGTYAKVAFSWATDRTVSSIKIVCNGETINGSGSGTSGSVSLVLGKNLLSTENSYTVTVTVTDSVGSASMPTTVAPMNYIMDIAPNGSVAFGKPANPNFRELAVNKPIQADKPTYGGQHSSNGGTNGYYKIFTIISRTTYANSGIRVPLYQRGILPSVLLFRLNMGNSSTISRVNSPMVLGYTDVWYKVNGSSVDFYSKKTEGWDQICVGQPEYDPRYMSGISFDFASAFYTSLPSGVTKVMNIHQDKLMELKSANGYWGMTHPGGDNDWIRTTKTGLIPYQAGGYGSLGTEGWPFGGTWTNSLSWTGNGLRGRVMKQIWSGSCSINGTITCSEFPRYNLFAARIHDWSTLLLGANVNVGNAGDAHVRFHHGYDNGSAHYNYYASFNRVSSTQWKLIGGCEHNMTTGEVQSIPSVTKIYGIL